MMIGQILNGALRVPQTPFLVLIAGAAMLLGSCAGTEQSSGKPAAREAGKASPVDSDRALQHFIEGSVYEMKGNYAQAILEYQDALRYDRNHAIYFGLAKCYSRLNKPAPAIESIREALRLAPEKTDYLRTLAEIYVSAFELDSAAVAYEEVVRRDSTDIQAWFTLANLYHGRKPLKALEVYEEITERFGDEWEVLLQVADLYNAMGKPEKAITALERMLAIDPGNIELKRSLAQACVRAQQHDRALELYTDLQELDPDNLDYLGEMATVYLMKKEYKPAAALFDRILERDTVDVEAKIRIGEAYFSQLQNDSTLMPVTISMFTHIRDLHPDDWRPYWYLGALGGISRNDSLTVKNFRMVTQLEPSNPDGWVYLASVYLQKQQYDSVASILEKAGNHVPDDYQVNLYLGLAYNGLGRSADAIEVLEKARQINPSDLRALTQLALIYEGQKRQTDADSLYEEALRIDPDNHLVLNNYGYSLADRGLQLERALAMAKKAVEAQPDNPSYLDTIGWVYFRLGDYEVAEKYVRLSLEKGEGSAVVHEHLGDIYYMNDKEDLALEQWNIALQLDSDNQSLREKIARGRL
jgi:tetratricopeptide (TPR) repeat protein